MYCKQREDPLLHTAPHAWTPNVSNYPYPILLASAILVLLMAYQLTSPKSELYHLIYIIYIYRKHILLATVQMKRKFTKDLQILCCILSWHFNQLLTLLPSFSATLFIPLTWTNCLFIIYANYRSTYCFIEWVVHMIIKERAPTRAIKGWCVAVTKCQKLTISSKQLKHFHNAVRVYIMHSKLNAAFINMAFC